MAMSLHDIFGYRIDTNEEVKTLLPLNNNIVVDLNTYIPTSNDIGLFFIHSGETNDKYKNGLMYKVVKVAHRFVANKTNPDKFEQLFMNRESYATYLEMESGDMDFDAVWMYFPKNNAEYESDEWVYALPTDNPIAIMPASVNEPKSLFSRNSECYITGYDTFEEVVIDNDLPFGDYAFVQAYHEGYNYIGAKVELDPNVITGSSILGNDVTFEEFVKAFNGNGNLVSITASPISVNRPESGFTNRLIIKSLLPLNNFVLKSNEEFLYGEETEYVYQMTITDDMFNDDGICVIDIRLHEDEPIGDIDVKFDIMDSSEEKMLCSVTYNPAFRIVNKTAYVPHGTYWVNYSGTSVDPSEGLNIIDDATTRRISTRFDEYKIRIESTSDENKHFNIYIPVPMTGDSFPEPCGEIKAKVYDANGFDITNSFEFDNTEYECMGGNYGGESGMNCPVISLCSKLPVYDNFSITVVLYDTGRCNTYTKLPDDLTGYILPSGSSLYASEMRRIQPVNLTDYTRVTCLDNGVDYLYTANITTENAVTGYFRLLSEID